jgi:hypothetical protein
VGEKAVVLAVVTFKNGGNGFWRLALADDALLPVREIVLNEHRGRKVLPETEI